MPMVRVADFIAQTLASWGIRDVFMVTGGGAMHLNDAIGRERRLRWHCCHHEQACAMAAESYYRLTGRLAAVNVTSGPGGTNAITGVFGAWTDSLGMVVVSGNVKWETMVGSTHLPLRQLGDQEADIVAMVRPITKYAVVVREAESVRYHVERALHLAVHGRPGPVWLDVPMNVQGALVDPAALRGYDPAEDAVVWLTPDVPAACTEILRRLRAAERPVILAGNGVRISGAYDRFLELVDRLGVPVTTPWNGHDLIWDGHPCYAGRPGIMGDRAGNFSVQNADLLISLGCRLSIRQVSYDWANFARAAYKVVIDVDAAELAKPTLSPDLPVHADVAVVIDALLAMTAEGYERPDAHRAYVDWCRERVRRYPTILPSYGEAIDKINPYVFLGRLFGQLPEGEVVVCADGSACVMTFHAAALKKGQRLYHNSGAAPMGYDLPAAIGACIGGGRRRVICLSGDGSIQMNLQELQTISAHRLPIKIFVINNDGYLSIRQTQTNYFPDNPIGCGPESGVTFPDFKLLAAAFGLPYRVARRPDELDEVLRETLALDGPALCEVVVDPAQGFAPKIASRKLPDGRMKSSPLEDMAPFLPREELRDNMIVDLLDD